jgi:Ni,Fe-hydrogenase I small subunit
MPAGASSYVPGGEFTMNGRTKRFTRRAAFAAIIVIAICSCASHGAIAQTDPLPFWNNGAVKKSIAEFVAKQNRKTIFPLEK